MAQGLYVAGEQEMANSSGLKKSVAKGLTSERHKRPLQNKVTTRLRGLEMVEALYGHSFRVIQHHLNDKNLRAAIWCADRYLDATGAVLNKPMDISEADTPSEAAKKVLRRIYDGTLSLDHGTRLMGLIERQAGIDASAEMDELREMIIALQTPDGVATSGNAPTPTWLRLKETHPINPDAPPAE